MVVILLTCSRSKIDDRNVIFSYLKTFLKRYDWKTAELILKNIGTFEYVDWQLKELMTPILENDKLKTFKCLLESQNIDPNSEYYGLCLGQQHRFVLLNYAIVKKAKKIIKYLLSLKNVKINNTSSEYSEYSNETLINNFILAAYVIKDKEILALFFSRPDFDINQSYEWLKKHPELEESIDNEFIKSLVKNKKVKSMKELSLQSETLPKFFNCNWVDSEGNNILHLALKHKNFKLFKNVVKQDGTLLNNFNFDNESPYDLLTKRYMDLILDHRKEKHDFKKISKNYKAFKDLLLKIRFCNIKDKDGNNLLHIAFIRGAGDIIQLILPFAPQLFFIKNNQKQIPFEIALQNQLLFLIIK